MKYLISHSYVEVQPQNLARAIAIAPQCDYCDKPINGRRGVLISPSLNAGSDDVYVSIVHYDMLCYSETVQTILTNRAEG